MLHIPPGTSYFWNPYSPKFYTIVGSSLDTSGHASTDDGSVGGALDDEEFDLAWATISSLRRDLTDAQIQHSIRRLPNRTMVMMLTALESSPSMMMELCEKERGNVMWQVMGALGGDCCAEFVRFVEQHARRLAFNQSGCIAYTRIYDAATPAQRAHLMRFAMENFLEISLHPFANYVIQRVLQDAPVHVYDAATTMLCSPAALAHLPMDKFGSHVVETFLKNAPTSNFVAVCRALLQADGCLINLAFDKVGNYVLQSALKKLVAKVDHNHALLQWAITSVPSVIAGSPFAPNINRSLGLKPNGRPMA